MYPGFYKEIAVIDKERDAELRVEPVIRFDFARNDCVLPVVCDELPALAGEYPVVFTTHQTPVMVALLGHSGNNFVEADGNWREGKYLPLVVRTYPFAGLYDKNGDLLLCIDRKRPGLGGTAGEKVFAGGGSLTPFGLHAAAFAHHFAVSMSRVHHFTRKLKDLDLLIPAEVTVEKNGKTHNFSGLSQVDMQRVSSLPHNLLKSFIDSGEMYFLYLHQHSLNNFARIV